MFDNLKQIKTEAEIEALLAEADRYYQSGTDRDIQRKAFDIYMDLYARGVADPIMFQRLGYYYYHGCSGTRDVMMGKYFFERAASLGDAFSNGFLGYMYEEGENVNQNIIKAISYYKKGGAGGNAWCLFRIGELYYEGIKISQNLRRAIRYHERAISGGYVNSYMAIAIIYNQIAKINNKCRKWYYQEMAFNYAQKAYKAGVVGAAGFLGTAYAFEKGVKHNYELAIKYDKEAIIEYRNLNMPECDIQGLEKFIIELEKENMREKIYYYEINLDN